MTYDAAGEYQVPGEEFDKVLEILQLDSDGKSRREIADVVEVPTSTVQNVLDRREWYQSKKMRLKRQIQVCTLNRPRRQSSFFEFTKR